MPRLSRNATNLSNSDCGRSRSATVVNFPAPRSTIQAPACSQLPMCGNAKITPRPAAIWAKAVCSSPVHRIRSRISSSPMTGSRKTSSQYRR